MGRKRSRFMRPDRTVAIGRAVRARLEPSERVLAGVTIQTPGTSMAGTQGGTAGGVAGALDVGVSFSDAGSGKHTMWEKQAQAIGIDPALAKKSVFLYLVLTTERVILVRRSRLTGRASQTLSAWPVGALDSLEVPRNGTSLTITVGGNPLRLELANAHKFLPDVYLELPARWEAARSAVRQAGEGGSDAPG